MDLSQIQIQVESTGGDFDALLDIAVKLHDSKIEPLIVTSILKSLLLYSPEITKLQEVCCENQLLWLDSFLDTICNSFHTIQTENFDYLRFNEDPCKEHKTFREEFVEFYNELARLLHTYGKELGNFYFSLSDAQSRQTLIEVLAFRLLGSRRIKLSTNCKSYWDSIKRAETLADNTRQIQTNFLNWSLLRHDLNDIGFDCSLFLRSKGISSQFIREQYSYRNDQIDISAKEGYTVIDAGGCWGDTALYFANRVGTHGKVYSFEFIPSNISIYKENISLNSHLSERIELIEKALWNTSGTDLFFKDRGPGSSVSFTAPETYDGRTKTITIDELVRTKNINAVDYIKMDIEGAEPFALEGAINTINKFKPDLSIAIYHSISDFFSIQEWILNLDLGYKIYLKHNSIHSEETVLFASCPNRQDYINSKQAVFVTKPSLPPLEEFTPYLEKIWESGRLSNNGPFHEQLEEELCRHLQVPYISLFANGTLALITALQTLEITGEVITTPFSFVATSHALLWNRLTPVFCDIDPISFNLDPAQIEKHINENTTAILPVHVYGTPCDVEVMSKIAEKNNLKIIYDAAHAFGVKKNGKSILQYGDLSILSFHPTKVFNTFEGGAIVCHDLETKKRIDYLKNFGFANELTVVGSGINAKMNEIQAAFGLLQLKHIDSALSKRAALSTLYRKELSNTNGLDLLRLPKEVVSNYSYFPILIDERKLSINRDDVYEQLKSQGIYTRRYFYPLIPDFPTYSSLPSSDPLNYPVARSVSSQILCLPIYPDLEAATVELICKSIKKMCSETSY